MAVQVLPQGKQHFDDATGAPLNGGKVFTYASGTLMPQATFSDAAGAVPNANPIILDTRGEAIVYWTQGLAYRVIVQDSAGNVIWPAIDGIVGQTINVAAIVSAGLRFRDLPDAFPSFTGNALKVVRVNAGETALEAASITLGSTTFRALTDAFASFTGKANQVVIVNSGETALTTDGTLLGDGSYKLGTNQSISSGVATTLSLSSGVYDQFKRGTYSSVNFTYTAGGSGARLIVIGQIMANIANGEDLQLWIEKNSTTKLALMRNVNEITSGSGNYYCQVARIITLAAGDTIRLRAQCSATRSIDSALENSFFDVAELG